MEELVGLYFHLGLSNKEILQCLAHQHHIIISLRTLMRVMKRRNLFRRKHFSDIVDLALFLVDELENSGKRLGYKLMHLKCRQEGLVVTQDTVRMLLHILDPVGVAVRRRHRLQRREYLNCGPNFLWHIDSYDKLKPYGICINGAIDGFSRYIVWLEAHCTSSDPKVVAGYFIQEVQIRKGCPARIRSDKGTENTHVRDMQRFMRQNHNDQYANISFLVGSSNHNQRIEQWWGILRRMNAQNWMDTFSMLKDVGSFSGDFLDKSLIQFCFTEIIQTELDQVVKLWNSHHVRSSRTSTSPSGRPFMMYNCPGVYGTHTFLCDVAQETVGLCSEETTPKGLPCDETVYELCTLLIEENGKQKATSAEEAVILYQFLREEVIRGLE
ncbi:uncharacterized protein LOC124277874 [Haliotis rubra]|uniref:uncharacterized protein LOC124277874 n=1 Tax=Haliotis rubra TaxID=36100 RepID=UPI001EE5890B|nr:uncharacterized protein LOC124277874 [Haliotis rubra]